MQKWRKNPESSQSYPVNIDTKAKQALYDNLNKNEELALSLDKKIREQAPSDWRGSKIKERLVKYLIKECIDDEETAEEVLKLIKEQEEY